MRLSLKTKFTLATSLLVLAVVALVSGLYIARLTRQTLRQADDRARFVAQQVYLACQNALTDAAARGESPASSSPADLRAYVQRALDNSSTLNSVMESAIGYSPTIYEITISDLDGIVLVSSDATLRGQKVAQRPPVDSLERGGFFQQLRTALRPAAGVRRFAALQYARGPFGDIRIGLSSALIRDEISPGLVSAGLLRAGVRAAFHSSRLRSSAALRSRRLSASPRNSIASPPANSILNRRRARRRIRRCQHQDHRHRKTIARRARDFQHSARKPRSGDGRPRRRPAALQRARRAVLVSPSVEKFLGVRSEVAARQARQRNFPARHPVA